MRILTAEWVLPVSSPPVANGAVAIEKDKIVAVGKKEALLKDYPTALPEDLGAAAIFPGLVNCHSHLELTAMRGLLDTVENDFLAWLLKLTKTRAEFFTGADIEFSALLGAVEGARAGVTCFGDVGRNGAASLKALKTSGLRGIVYQETEFTPDENLAEENFQKLKEKFLLLKESETALIETGISPHAPYTVCAGLFKRIAEFAQRENIKTSIHTAESNIEDDFLLRGEGVLAKLWRKNGAPWQPPGVSAVKYLSSLGVLDSKPLLVHCVNVGNAAGGDLDLIAGSGSSIAHCPKSNAKFGHGIAPLENILAKEIAVGLGSDSVASNNTCDLIEEARFAALLARTRSDKQEFIAAGEIIRLMTLGGARALGLEKEIGSLEAGKQADLAVISLQNAAQMPVYDPESAVLFASGGRDVILTVVAGEDIYRNGQMKKVDEAGVKEMARELVQRISA
jgi:5-methylthioadenosine/S-adenosylhomocysteine deaminase